MRWHSIKKGVFGISKELQFRFSNNGKLYASPCTGRERELLWRGKGSWEGYSTLRLWLLLAEFFPGKKRSLFWWGSFGLPRWHSRKESAYLSKRCRFYPWPRKNPWRKKQQPTPVFLPGEFHGQRILAPQSMGHKRVRHKARKQHTLLLQGMRAPLTGSLTLIGVAVY